MKKEPKPQIIAMGGGGFSMEPDNPLLDAYILKQTGKQVPSVCFLPTASGDANGYVVKFHEAFAKLPCRHTHLSLFRPPRDLKDFVLSQDVIYVGGGHTSNMLVLWREWGLDRMLRTAWKRGVVMTGLSAGSLCWFEEGLTDSVPGRWTAMKCLGFLRGSHSPHYDGEPGRRPVYRRLIRQGKLKPGLAADDGVALHFMGRRLVRAVSSRPTARAYHLRVLKGRLEERMLLPEFLGKKA